MTLPQYSDSMNTAYALYLVEQILTANMKSTAMVMQTCSWDGHGSCFEADSVLVGLSDLPERYPWTRCHHIPSPSPTWGYSALSYQREVDARWEFCFAGVTTTSIQ